MLEPLQIFIGWDARETAAYHVLCHSIITRAGVPVSITPLTQHVLRQSGAYTRVKGPTESTDFSLTRFLVPALSGYKGHSLFLDCDMLVQADITELWMHGLVNIRSAVSCCQHDYTPKAFQDGTREHGMTAEVDAAGHAYLAHSECDDCREAMRRGIFVKAPQKFLGQSQTAYPRKNWSSVMLFNNDLCRNLTPDYVNQATGLELHRLKWAKGEIGSIPLEWNWLVGEYPPNPQAKNLHWTNGGPWFAETADCDHADLWRREQMDAAGIPALIEVLK